MSPKKLSRMIQQLREAKGMTQRDLATRVGVTPGYIAQLELGQKKNPSVPVLRRLARALGVPVGELLE
jgi:transcriptional regulator with XRE-family HTH domain